MAIKLTTTTHGRGDVTRFDPRDLIPHFAAYTGRSERTAEAIEAMAQSLMEVGQQQAILYRKDAEGNAVPINGHTRILAAALITERTGDTFLIRGEYRDRNAEEAVWDTFAENNDKTRTPLTPMEIALFIRTVSEQTGISDAEIARRTGHDPAWVSRHRKLLTLDNSTREAVKGMKLDAAIKVAALTPKKQKEVVAKIKKGAKVADAVRDTGTASKRTYKEVMEWFRDHGGKFPEAVLEFAAGKIGIGELTEVYEEVVR